VAVNSITFQSKADHPRALYTGDKTPPSMTPAADTQYRYQEEHFAPLTLTLTWRPWYMNMTWGFWRCTSTPKMNFLGQGFRKSEHYWIPTQTDATGKKVRDSRAHGELRRVLIFLTWALSL